jgi:hypothetical protein
MSSSTAPSEHPLLDRLLDRYVAVWIWSILFGTSTGLLYAFSETRWRDWGPLTAALAIPAVFGFAFAFMAWRHLLRGLRRYVIPTYVLRTRDTDVEEFSKDLSRAIAFVINAALFKVVLAVVEVALAAFGRG